MYSIINNIRYSYTKIKLEENKFIHNLNANKKTNYTCYQHKNAIKKKKTVFYNFLKQSPNAFLTSAYLFINLA